MPSHPLKSFKLRNTSLLIVLILGIFVNFSCKKESRKGDLPSKNNQEVGAAANDLLAVSKYNTLTIEVSYMPGVEPSAASLNNLKTFLSNLLNKPAGINITKKSIASGNQSTYSTTELRAIEVSNRKAFTTDKNIAVHVLVVDGGSPSDNENGSVLGVAYRNTSIALYGKNIVDNTGGIGAPTKTTLESTILDHEFGHILGLVNIGTSPQSNHEDGAHPGHCTVENCLMYFAVETTASLGNLLGGNIPSLDAQCRADLTANGGK